MIRAAAIAAPRLRARAERNHTAGVAFVLVGVTCWSLGGVLVRLTEGIDAWQIIFYRSIVVLVVLGAWVFYLHGARTLDVIARAGLNAVIAGIAIGLSGITFVMALFYTTVAQVIFMAGVTPFVSALLGWWILRERVNSATWVAMFVALGGLAVMVLGSSGEGALIGSILALYSSFCFSCYSVLLRWGQRTEMNVATLWNAVLLILVSAAVILALRETSDVSGPQGFAIGWRNLLFVTIMGAVQLSLGLILFTRGSRSVPAAELALLALLEPTLSPIWAWLAVGEIPAPSTLFGGSIIMAAIVLRVAAGARR